MWNGKRVSVVLMTYAERDSIRAVIDGFFDTGLVDEVLVVDNNAEAGTAEEVDQTRARLVHEPRQGYGHATRRGLVEASRRADRAGRARRHLPRPRTSSSCSSTAASATPCSAPAPRAS